MRKFMRSIRNWLTRRSFISALTTKEDLFAPQRELVWASPSEWTNWQSTADTGSMTVTINAESAHTLTGAQAQDMGIALASAQLQVIEKAYSKDVAACYAQGFACAARDYMIRQRGSQYAYERFAIMADSVIEAQLPQGQ